MRVEGLRLLFGSIADTETQKGVIMPNGKETGNQRG